MTLIPEELRLRLDIALENLASTFSDTIRVLGAELTANDYLDAIYESDRQLNGYRSIPDVLQTAYRQLEAHSGREAVNIFNKTLMLQMMLSSEDGISDVDVPEEVRLLIIAYFDRVLTEITGDRDRSFRYENDLRAKDMGVCRLRLIPCGAELIDRFSGIPRRALISRDMRQVINTTKFFIFKSRHFTRFFESHWDRRLVREFSPRGIEHCYLKIASILEKNPQFHGVFGSTWWLDPAIENISPDLFFLQKLFIDNRALSINMGTDDEAIMDATTFAPKRKLLYKEGKYIPRRYLFIWHREDIFRWRDKLKAAE